MNYKNQYYKKILKYFVVIILLVSFEVLFIDSMTGRKVIPDINAFREMNITDRVIAEFLDHKSDSEDVIGDITVSMLWNQFKLDNTRNIRRIQSFSWKEKMEEDVYNKYYEYYKEIFQDLVYFPVPEDIAGGQTVSFTDSWMYERTYGGNRFHEGTDIMSGNNVRGYFPVVSITDGFVEQMGWLEKGGYRIGIRSASGGYFYYAHLYRYAKGLKMGDAIKAGTLIGYMGDSGYSKIEGTVGNFDVHLHLGIYINGEEGELSVNPYWILKYLENNKLNF